MDKDKVVAQPTLENTTANTLLEMFQQNTLAIQNLENNVAIIKKTP